MWLIKTLKYCLTSTQTDETVSTESAFASESQRNKCVLFLVLGGFYCIKWGETTGKSIKLSRYPTHSFPIYLLIRHAGPTQTRFRVCRNCRWNTISSEPWVWSKQDRLHNDAACSEKTAYIRGRARCWKATALVEFL